MKKFLLAAVLVGLFAPGVSWAQSTITVNIHRAKLVWEWTQGAAPEDGIPEKFIVKCGQASGQYTKLTDVAYPTRELAVRDAILGNGQWFCAVSSWNVVGESATNSNEVPFVAGAPASPPRNNQVVAQ